jgi:hypothetical protein
MSAKLVGLGAAGVVLALVGSLIGGLVVAAGSSERITALEASIAGLRDEVKRAVLDADTASAAARQARSAADRLANGVVRIKLTDAHEPQGIFGGIQAFVETGTTERGCIASVSETSVGNLGPFYVLCTPRAPVIGGVRREGILLQIRTRDAGGSSGQLFPPGSIVEVTLWQPGALRYAEPVPCVIGAPDQC